MAPWWAQNSKEAYSTGLADLPDRTECQTALNDWAASKTGRRKGRRVGFPQFKSPRRDQHRVQLR